MKKSHISIGLIIVLLVGGYIAYRNTNSSSTESVPSANLTQVNTPTSTCADAVEHAKIVCLADALKASITDSALLASLQLPYTVTDAQKWSNFPPAGYRDRVGPTLSQFNETQLSVIQEIIK